MNETSGDIDIQKMKYHQPSNCIHYSCDLSDRSISLVPPFQFSILSTKWDWSIVFQLCPIALHLFSIAPLYFRNTAGFEGCEKSIAHHPLRISRPNGVQSFVLHLYPIACRIFNSTSLYSEKKGRSSSLSRILRLWDLEKFRAHHST